MDGADAPGLFPTPLRPLAGGHSGETFVGDAAGEQVVARIYGGRSLARGPLAPEVDAAVLELVRGLVPVPRVLEVRRGEEASGLPGLLLTELLPGERLETLMPRLEPDARAAVGAALGTLLGRLGHLAQPRPGLFTDLGLTADPLPHELRDLTAWVDQHADDLDAVLGREVLAGLRAVADAAQDLLEEDRRSVLVHGDLNAANVLVDPATLVVTGVLDWEFAHAGSPYADLGHLLRLDRDPAYADAVVAAYRDFMPSTPPDLLDRARAVDLYSLVDLAVRAEDHLPVVRARELLVAVVRTGDLHAC